MLNTQLFDITTLNQEKLRICAELAQKKMESDKSFCTGTGLDGQEVMPYILFGQRYVESFDRLWQRLADSFTVQIQSGETEYMETEELQLYDHKAGFVNCSCIARTVTSDWSRVKLSNGRALTCAGYNALSDKSIIEIDHTNGFMRNYIGYNFKTTRAWMLGVVLCDGAYSGSIVVSLAGEGEDDIAEKLRGVWKQEYGYNAITKHQQRGIKGNYKDIRMDLAGASREKGNCDIRNKFIEEFGGIRKYDRRIPNEIFRSNRDSQLAFLAGMIDADGYLDDRSITIVQLGSTNKELALQQLHLAQALGMPASLYLCVYSVNGHRKIRYRVEFIPTDELMAYVVCKKKKAHFGNTIRSRSSIRTKDIAAIKEIVILQEETYAYRVVTESGHYTASGIWCQADANI